MGDRLKPWVQKVWVNTNDGINNFDKEEREGRAGLGATVAPPPTNEDPGGLQTDTEETSHVPEQPIADSSAPVTW